MIRSNGFPKLTSQNHSITSPSSTDYNCIAWAAGDVHNWWQPGVYWPLPVMAGDYGIGVLEQAMQFLGFVSCDNEMLEVGFEKIALYGDSMFYTHAARQLPSGKWTSKLGGAEDIEHDTPENIAGGVYGSVVGFMKRPLPAVSH